MTRWPEVLRGHRGEAEVEGGWQLGYRLARPASEVSRGEARVGRSLAQPPPQPPSPPPVPGVVASAVADRARPRLGREGGHERRVSRGSAAGDRHPRGGVGRARARGTGPRLPLLPRLRVPPVAWPPPFLRAAGVAPQGPPTRGVVPAGLAACLVSAFAAVREAPGARPES